MGIYLRADPIQLNTTAAMLMKIGQQAFSIMVPVLPLIILHSISGRPRMVVDLSAAYWQMLPAQDFW